METFVDRKNFSFFSKALGHDVFEVVQFSGREAISQPYEFSITLSARDSDIDLKWLLRNPATLVILRGGEPVPISGVLASFEQLHEANHRAFYRAVLVPKLWHLGLYRENRLFLNKSVPQVLDETLKQSGLSGADYELKLTRSYPTWEYICQYAESNLDFISRWMEREGIYYYFKQSLTGEKLIITDNSSVHQGIPGISLLPYTPSAGLVPEVDEVVTGLVCRQRVLPKKIILKDYNYRKPTLDVRAEAIVDPNGREEVYIYGEHFKDASQGKDLAAVRAGESLCRESVYYGQGTCPRLAPGFTFELGGHYRVASNRKYLITEVEHRGLATGVLLTGLGEPDQDAQPGYSCSFACIPSGVQFRPERKTPRPRINGTMNAVIDAAGDGSHAELDDQGRYKVILPFDLSGRNGGKASCWVRMAQPYSGSDYGVHFPLHKGAEVLLTFIDGDVDRPIISSAVPNPNTQSPVTNSNQSKSVIRDNYGNEIVMDTTQGAEGIRLHSPRNDSTIELGKEGEESFTQKDKSEGRIGNRYEWGVGGLYSAFFGPAAEFRAGVLTDINLAVKNSVTLGGTHEIDAGYKVEYSRGPKFHFGHEEVGSHSDRDNIVSARKTLCLIGGADRTPSNITDNTSIIAAGEKKISLTVGKKTEVIEPSLGKIDKLLLASVAAAAAISTGLAADPAHGSKRKNLVISSSVFLGLSAALGAWFGLKKGVTKGTASMLEKVVAQPNPAAKIEMNRNGELEINSNGKAISPGYKNQVMLSTGDGTGARITLQGTEVKVESVTNDKVESSISMRRFGASTIFKIFSNAEVQIRTERTGVALNKSAFTPLKPTDLVWPNLRVKFR